MKIVVATGGFDPLHRGHIRYLEAAKDLGAYLIVGVNSDDWLIRKKGRYFMPWTERAAIVRALGCVDEVVAFDDTDGSACKAIEYALRVKNDTRNWIPFDSVIFANGGDRTQDNIPEMVFEEVEFVFGVGGEDKANSSSWILEEWKSPKTVRQWGYYRVLHEVEGCKVKELTVEPGKSLSMQKHAKRNEYWLVSEGKCIVNSRLESGYEMPPKQLEKHDEFTIICGEWHQLTNPFSKPCRVVEIQYGNRCDEDDITRL
jgi:cytidyltransferase-like protein